MDEQQQEERCATLRQLEGAFFSFGLMCFLAFFIATIVAMVRGLHGEPDSAVLWGLPAMLFVVLGLLLAICFNVLLALWFHYRHARLHQLISVQKMLMTGKQWHEDHVPSDYF